MDAFAHLSVLVSIILGLAITQVLQGFRGIVLARTGPRVLGASAVGRDRARHLRAVLVGDVRTARAARLDLR